MSDRTGQREDKKRRHLDRSSTHYMDHLWVDSELPFSMNIREEIQMERLKN